MTLHCHAIGKMTLVTGVVRVDCASGSRSQLHPVVELEDGLLISSTDGESIAGQAELFFSRVDDTDPLAIRVNFIDSYVSGGLFVNLKTSLIWDRKPS